jgi:hypothetical protein
VHIGSTLKIEYIVTYLTFSWLITTGSGLDDWILWHFDYNYNQLYQIKINDCLTLAPFLTRLRVPSHLLDWLGSDLRIGHFFGFICPLANTPQLITELFYECQIIDSFTNEFSWTELTSRRTVYRPPSPTVRVFILFYPLPRECVFGEPLASNRLPRLFVAAGTCFTKPLSSNVHIRHNLSLIMMK